MYVILGLSLYLCPKLAIMLGMGCFYGDMLGLTLSLFHGQSGRSALKSWKNLLNVVSIRGWIVDKWLSGMVFRETVAVDGKGTTTRLRIKLRRGRMNMNCGY